MRIVNTCNFDRDYPNESFINLPPLSDETAETIAILINKECSGERASRYWKVVKDDYQLAPTMEDDMRNDHMITMFK